MRYFALASKNCLMSSHKNLYEAIYLFLALWWSSLLLVQYQVCRLVNIMMSSVNCICIGCRADLPRINSSLTEQEKETSQKISRFIVLHLNCRFKYSEDSREMFKGTAYSTHKLQTCHGRLVFFQVQTNPFGTFTIWCCRIELAF